MLGIGGFELFLILLFGFLIFGPDKLPVMAKMAGKAISKFRKAQEEMTNIIKTEVYDPSSDEPFKNPIDALAKLGEGDKSKSGSKSGASKTSASKTTTGSKPTSNKPTRTVSSSKSATAGKATASKGSSISPTSKSSSASSASKAGNIADGPERKESFSERKARYDRERAAKLEAEKKAAESAASDGKGE